MQTLITELSNRNISSKDRINYLKSQFNKYKYQADFVSFKWISEKTKDIKVRNSKFENIHTFFDQGLMIEVFINGHFGHCGTCEITEQGINKAFERAIDLTKVFSQYKLFEFNPFKTRGSIKGTYQSNSLNKLNSLKSSEIIEFLIKASDLLKNNHRIQSTFTDTTIIECQHYYLNTLGAEIDQSFEIIMNQFGATAVNGLERQTRTLNGGKALCYQGGSEYFNFQEIEDSLNKIRDEAILLTEAENCPSKISDILIAPDQMQLQIHESIGHPLELDRILGDERNFAGWSFIQPSDFGKLQYGSEMLNVTFDPTVSNELASYAFDDVGLKSEKKFLIKNGLLVSGLGSLESQNRFKKVYGINIDNVANSRSSSWNRAAIDRMANINIEPSNTSLQNIISSIENGVLMCSNKSWSIDDYRNKFQFGCEIAYQIKEGEIKSLFKNPNYRGQTIPFWNSLMQVSDSESTQTFGSPYCGKGEPSQIIRVGHRSPYGLFKNVEIFGG